MQINKQFNNIKTTTKIRTTGTGLVTTIPKTVVQLLGINENDIICWNIDIKNNTINIDLIQEKSL